MSFFFVLFFLSVGHTGFERWVGDMSLESLYTVVKIGGLDLIGLRGGTGMFGGFLQWDEWMVRFR